MSTVAIDIGGTWCRGVLSTDGIVSRRIRVPSKHPASAVEDTWNRLGSPDAWALACAPRVDESGQIVEWPSRPETIGQRLWPMSLPDPVLVLDDGNAAALAEDNGQGVTVAIWSGTGVGAGLVVEGRLVTGAHGATMDIGHLRVPAAGDTTCVCGARGCLQTVASARAWSSDSARAEQAVQQALATVCKLLDPDRIVLGGPGFSGNASLNLKQLPGYRIESSRWGEWAGCLGVQVALDSSPVARLSRRRVAFIADRINDRQVYHRVNMLPRYSGPALADTREELDCELIYLQVRSQQQVPKLIDYWSRNVDAFILALDTMGNVHSRARETAAGRGIPVIELHPTVIPPTQPTEQYPRVQPQATEHTRNKRLLTLEHLQEILASL